ncbi:MAG TPA: hypothetical protein VG797_03895 [Phycisphaerales bacterium]|nr:hypothetical protein [Phycisphaerales bacterium]
MSTSHRVISPIRSPLTGRDAVDRLERLARRGKLAGFERMGAESFVAAIFGAPFDREYVGRVESAGDEGGCVIRGESRLKMKIPLIYAIVLVVSVWPGVWLTDSMLKTYFSWYRIETWWWYLPLCALCVPAVMKQWKSSERVAGEETELLLKKIAGEVEGMLEGSPVSKSPH